jgi:hypothetical protein
MLRLVLPDTPTRQLANYDSDPLHPLVKDVYDILPHPSIVTTITVGILKSGYSDDFDSENGYFLK